jgi:endonuclease/exonuclease/phosphatase (EEP) superfamily protein YafD
LTTSFWAFPHRAEQQRAAQLRGLAEDIAANPHPMVVAGDFNTSPAMADVDQLSHQLDDPTGTSSSLYPTSWTPGGPLFLWRLDWVFVSSGVNVHRYGFRSSRGLSDHRAQDLSLTFR